MKNIFDLVPSDQRGLLDGFLKKGDDAAAAGPTGQHADFSRLDAGAVTSAINASVVGQPAVVGSVVATAFRRARLARPHKPVAVFLFVGATGAGKTELAKSLAGQLFGGRMIRLDCAEMSSEASVQRLIGSPPGYIGSEAGGWLCRELARIGTGVLLFDEIEKAHPAVLKSVMGLLDEARLTEQSTGTTYYATGFVIVLTSNAQQAEIAQIAAATPDDVERSRKVRDELKAHGFLPEVLARIDAIFPFAPLSRAAVVEIVGRALQRQATGCGVELEAVDAALLIDLVTRGETLKDYGVRELLRQVEAVVTDGLLDARDRGETRVAIRVDDAGAVRVEAVEARP